MKDARFVEEEKWSLANERGRSHAEAQLRELGDAEVLLGSVRALLARQGNDDVVRNLPESLSEDLDRFVCGLDVRTDAAWFAIAKGLASLAIADAPSTARLVEMTSRLERAPQWVHHAFHEECVALLAELDDESRDRWLALVAAPPPLLVARPQTSRAAIHVAQREADWKVLDPFELWDEGGAAIPLMAAYEPLQLLRRFDEQRWFRAVDAWDDGRLVFAALFGSHVLHDRDALLRYLSEAAAVFDESGKWTGRTAAIVLARNVIEHAGRLANAVRGIHYAVDAEREAAIARLCTEELPKYFSNAWRTLLARADGLAIAAASHVRLAEPQGVRGVFHIDVPAIAFRSLSECLVDFRPSLSDLRKLWRLRRDAHAPGRSKYVSALRSLSCAMAVAERNASFDTELFEWLEEVLRGDSLQWRHFASERGLPSLIEQLAEALAKSADAVRKFQTLYASLEPTRRRGEFGRTYAENDADFASIVMIAVLVEIVGRRFEASSTAEAVDASKWLFHRALRLFLVTSPGFEPTFSARAVLTLAIELRVRVDRSSLAECLAPVLSDPGHAAEVLAALLSVVDRDDVERIIAPTCGTLLGLNHRAEEWAVATADPSDRKAVDSLAAAIRTRT